MQTVRAQPTRSRTPILAFLAGVQCALLATIVSDRPSHAVLLAAMAGNALAVLRLVVPGRSRLAVRPSDRLASRERQRVLGRFAALLLAVAICALIARALAR